jgi:hypothetical protein
MQCAIFLPICIMHDVSDTLFRYLARSVRPLLSVNRRRSFMGLANLPAHSQAGKCGQKRSQAGRSGPMGLHIHRIKDLEVNPRVACSNPGESDQTDSIIKEPQPRSAHFLVCGFMGLSSPMFYRMVPRCPGRHHPTHTLFEKILSVQKYMHN